jgi:Ca-activated chloride channel family protein
MARALTALAALFLLLVPAGAQQKTVFRTGVQTVVLHATVRGEGGRLVPDLTAGDFEIRDDGQPVPISVFSNDPQPITVALLLDMSGSMVGQFLRVREATMYFVDAIQPGDRVRIGTFGEEVALSPLLTGDKQVLHRIVADELWPGGGTPLWNAVNAGMQSLAGEPGRCVVLALTDGGDTGGLPGLDGKAGDARKAVEDQGFMVYAIGLEGRQLDDGIVSLAERSGGGHFLLEKDADLEATFARVIEELRHQYEIGYLLPKADGKLHDVDVRVKKPGMTVRAKKSYRAPKSAS